MVAVYALGVHESGDRDFEVMYADDVEQIKEAAKKSMGGKLSPSWQNWPERMALKSVMKRFCKRLITDQNDAELMQIDTKGEIGEQHLTLESDTLNSMLDVDTGELYETSQLDAISLSKADEVSNALQDAVNELNNE